MIFSHSIGLICFNNERLIPSPIKRHIKIKGEAHPYDLKWENYFEDRLKCKMLAALRGHRKLLTLWKNQNGRCPVCKQAISKETSWHLHHILKKVNGGSDELSNLVLAHPNCHRQIHSQGLSVVKIGSSIRVFERLEPICGESRTDGS